MIKSKRHGKRISESEAEVQHTSPYGMWVLVKGKEYFLPFKKYPWFKEARPSARRKVSLLHGRHLYWPHLDVDLDMVSLEHPEHYPLVYYP